MEDISSVTDNAYRQYKGLQTKLRKALEYDGVYLIISTAFLAASTIFGVDSAMRPPMNTELPTVSIILDVGIVCAMLINETHIYSLKKQVKDLEQTL